MEDIEEQLVIGEEGLKEEDKWLLEVTLDKLDGETTGGERGLLGTGHHSLQRKLPS